MITLVIVGKQAESIGPLLTEKQAGWERERPGRLPGGLLGNLLRRLRLNIRP